MSSGFGDDGVSIEKLFEKDDSFQRYPPGSQLAMEYCNVMNLKQTGGRIALNQVRHGHA